MSRDYMSELLCDECKTYEHDLAELQTKPPTQIRQSTGVYREKQAPHDLLACELNTFYATFDLFSWGWSFFSQRRPPMRLFDGVMVCRDDAHSTTS